jgi:hypothetical protein
MAGAEHLQEGLGADDADAVVLVKIEKIAITVHEVVRRAFDGAPEVAIIGRVVADWRHEGQITARGSGGSQSLAAVARRALEHPWRFGDAATRSRGSLPVCLTLRASSSPRL